MRAFVAELRRPGVYRGGGPEQHATLVRFRIPAGGRVNTFDAKVPRGALAQVMPASCRRSSARSAGWSTKSVTASRTRAVGDEVCGSVA